MGDPYSVAGSGSSGSTGNGNSRNRSSSRDCPPQLPPRDNGIYSLGPTTHAWSNVSIMSNEDQEQNRRQNKKEKKKTGDDPYYFGLSARIPNFVKSRKKKQKERNRPNQGQYMDSSYSSGPTSLPSLLVAFKNLSRPRMWQWGWWWRRIRVHHPSTN